MKKIIALLILSFYIATAFPQVSFKLGILNSINLDDTQKHSPTVFGSCMAEVNYSISGTVAATVSGAWLRHPNEGEGFSQFPLLAGIKYRFDETFYASISGGISWFDEKIKGSNFTFSPCIGANIKRLSVDIRYIHVITANPIRTPALVISYNF